jgi:hypothetical protein
VGNTLPQVEESPEAIIFTHMEALLEEVLLQGLEAIRRGNNNQSKKVQVLCWIL